MPVPGHFKTDGGRYPTANRGSEADRFTMMVMMMMVMMMMMMMIMMMTTPMTMMTQTDRQTNRQIGKLTNCHRKWEERE